MSKNWNIKNKNGEVLYTGTANTKKEFVEQLIKDKKDLRGANLSRLSLNNLNLKGALLSEADLTGTDFTGSDLTGADLSFSICNPVEISRNENGVKKTWYSKTKFVGCHLFKANLNGANLSGVNAKGATLEGATLNGCIINNANFSEISASRSSWMFTKGMSAIFRSAHMVNADFYSGRFIKCDFSGADLSHQILTGEKLITREKVETHLHDRTEDAIFVASLMDKETILSHTVPRLIKDSKFNETFSKICWVGSTLGGAFIADKGLELFNETMGEHVHHIGGAAILVVGGVALLAKEFTSDYIKDHTKEFVNTIALKSRELLKSIKTEALEKIDLVALVSQKKTLDPIRMALLSTQPTLEKKGFFATIKESLVGNLGSVIICDRKHLATTMKFLSLHRDNIYPTKKDITLIRCDGHHDKSNQAPCVIRFQKDGSMSTVWSNPNTDGHSVIKYDKHGKIIDCWDNVGNKIKLEDIGLEKTLTRTQVIDTFEKALLSENGLFNFTYDRKTHHIKNGMKNSILIFNNKDKLLDNMDGQPALLTVNNKKLFMKRGGLIKSKEEKESKEKKLYLPIDEPQLKI